MNQTATTEAFITAFVREHKDRIHRILGNDELDIVEKTILLRRIAREIAEKNGPGMQYRDLKDFEAHYDSGDTPLTRLEGDGFRVGELFVLKSCPMVPVFGAFKKDGEFPAYWSVVTDEYMKRFQNESLLHPLCIVHQTFRDLLTSKIPKGTGFVHSITVACRSGASGKVVHNTHGLKIAGVTGEEVDRVIEGWACAFYAK